MFSMPIAGDDPVLLLGLSAFALLLVALPWGFWALSSGKTSSGVRVLIALANLALTAQLVLRWWQSGHFPISNLYESLCFLAWACTSPSFWWSAAGRLRLWLQPPHPWVWDVWLSPVLPSLIACRRHPLLSQRFDRAGWSCTSA